MGVFIKALPPFSLSDPSPCLLISSSALRMSVPTEPPPDYEYAVSHPPAVQHDQHAQHVQHVQPPGYQVAAVLPSYQQAEMDKEKLIAGHAETDHPRAAGRESILERGEWDDDVDMDLALLGTDLAFFSAFLTAFLFNWVGFLLLMCFCHTIAARYGALAGFGLSLSKWTLIVKRSTDMIKDENAWLWWLVLAFGFLICVRACTQFVQIKRSWRHLSSSARERLFFFY